MRALIQWITCKKNKDDNDLKLGLAGIELQKMQAQGATPQAVIDDTIKLNESQAKLLAAQADTENPVSTWQRPVLFFSVMLWFNAHKLFIIIGGVQAHLPFDAINAALWGDSDIALLSALAGYVLADRTIKLTKI